MLPRRGFVADGEVPAARLLTLVLGPAARPVRTLLGRARLGEAHLPKQACRSTLWTPALICDWRTTHGVDRSHASLHSPPAAPGVSTAGSGDEPLGRLERLFSALSAVKGS